MDEPREQHAWRKKPDAKGHATCDSICTELQNGHTDRDAYRREASRPGSGRGGTAVARAWVGEQGCGLPWFGLGRERVGTAVAWPGSGAGWGPHGCVDLLTLRQLRLWHSDSHSSGNRLKMLKCASEAGRFYGM